MNDSDDESFNEYDDNDGKEEEVEPAQTLDPSSKLPLKRSDDSLIRRAIKRIVFDCFNAGITKLATKIARELGGFANSPKLVKIMT